MRLLEIEAHDFLSYPVLALDLTGINRLAVVGRNGSGKSALLDAILWCLFAKGRGMSDEMVRDGALSCWVRTTWERTTNGLSSVVVVTRSRDKATDESSLAVYEDGEEISKSKIPLTQALIEKLVGMGFEAMCAGPVMIQPGSPGAIGSLLQKKPAEAKDLLVELFQLERWSAYHEAAKVSRDSIKRRLEEARAHHVELQQALGDEKLEDLQKEVTDYESALAIGESALEGMRGHLTELREEAAVLRARSQRTTELTGVIAAAVADLDRIERSKVTTKAKLDGAVNIIDNFVIPDEVTVDDLGPTRADVDYVKVTAQTIGEARVLASTLERLTSAQAGWAEKAAATIPCEGNPPGCQFILAAANAQREVDRLDAEIVDATAAKELVEQLTPALRVTEERIAAADRIRHDRLFQQAEVARQITRAQATIEQAKVDQSQAMERLAELGEEQVAVEARHRDAVRERAGLQQDEYRMAELATLIDGTTQLGVQKKGEVDELRRAISTDKALIAALEKLVDEIAETESRLTTGEADLVLYESVVKMFHRDGIPTLILETAIPEIERRANEVLARLPDDYTIRLDTKVATKAQTFKDELRVVVLSGGRERPFHMLSGGQRFRVEFAIRIALSAVIAARVDATVDTLWLDEPLGQLDKEGQEAVSDTLAAFAEDFGLIVVVSHVADFNDQQETKVSVSIDQGESTAEIAA